MDEENATDCPTSAGLWLADMETEGSEFTVIVAVPEVPGVVSPP